MRDLPKRIWLLLSVVVLAGCGTSMSYYQQTSPELKLEEFYNGRLTAYGLVQDRGGKVLRRFRVEMLGRWQGNKGVLEETFFYDDGEQQERTWHLEKQANGRYGGTALDVTRPASGISEGFAMNWQYTLAITVDDAVWNIDFDDWMYLLDENRLINRAHMRKWGFNVGEVTLWIEKH